MSIASKSVDFRSSEVVVPSGSVLVNRLFTRGSIDKTLRNVQSAKDVKLLQFTQPSRGPRVRIRRCLNELQP